MPDWIGTFQIGRVITARNGVNTALTLPGRVFPRPFTHGGFPPHMWRQVQGDKALMGGTHERDIDLMGGT